MADAAPSDSTPTLKVMRLYKPKMYVSLPGVTDVPGNPLRESKFAISNFFILPDSFGNIYLGEVFCSYISVLNQYSHDLRSVGLTAQLQTPNGRTELFDVRAQVQRKAHDSPARRPKPAPVHLCPHTTAPLRAPLSPRRTHMHAQRGDELPQNPAVLFRGGQSLDMVVEHSLQDLGVHTLRVGVTYTDRETGEAKSLRKLYRFNVTSPLTMDFRHVLVQGSSFVEAQLRNTTNSQVRFYPDQLRAGDCATPPARRHEQGRRSLKSRISRRLAILVVSVVRRAAEEPPPPVPPPTTGAVLLPTADEHARL